MTERRRLRSPLPYLLMVIFSTQSAERRPQGIEERVAPPFGRSLPRLQALSTNLFTFFVKKILGLVALMG